MFFFRGWGTLAAVISVATVISFLTGPVSVMALRTHAADLPRPLRVACMPVVAPFAFVCASLVLYRACCPLTGQIILLIVVALPIPRITQSKNGWADFRRGGWRRTCRSWRCCRDAAGASSAGTGSSPTDGIWSRW